MSSTLTFFDFFDALNDQVQTFGRALDDSRSSTYGPHSESVDTKQKSTESNKKKDNNGWFDEWSTAVIPAADLLEHDNSYELNVAIPGIKDKKDINVEYHKETNQIIVSGEIPSTVTEENKDRVKVKELASGKFRRVITLPKTSGVEADSIKAAYTNGVLRLDIPKLESAQRKEVKKIVISSD